MASNFLYTHPTDNIADVVTPTRNISDAAGLGWARAIDKNPATAYEASAAGEWTAVWDFVTPVNVRWAAMVMPNIPATHAGVTLEGNTSNSWPGAVVINFTIPAWAEDGFPWNPYVVNTDLTAYRFWRIKVPAFTGVFKFNEIGLFNTYRTLEFNINWEANLVEKTLVSEHRTTHNTVTEYDKGVRWFEVNGEIDATDAGRAEMRSWIRAASGRGKRFFFVPDLDGETQENHAWFGKFLRPDLLQTLAFLDWTKLQVGWEELSRGLKP